MIQARFQSPPERGTACRCAMRLDERIDADLSFNPLQNGERPAGPPPSRVLPSSLPGFNPLQNGERPAGRERFTLARATKIPGFNPLQNGERPAGSCANWGRRASASRFNPLQNGERPAGVMIIVTGNRREDKFQSPPERGTACKNPGAGATHGHHQQVSIPSRTGNGLQATPRSATRTSAPTGFNPLQNGERPARSAACLFIKLSSGEWVSIPSRTGNGLQAAAAKPGKPDLKVFQSPPERGTACRAPGCSLTRTRVAGFQSPPERGTACKLAAGAAFRAAEEALFQSPPERGTACK